MPPALSNSRFAGGSMTKSELIEKLATDFPHIQVKDVEASVKEILEQMAQSLASNERIEIRGFGSFFLCFNLLFLCGVFAFLAVCSSRV